MDGEILTSGEMREAMNQAEILRAVIDTNPHLAVSLTPAMDLLFSLAWKGMKH